MITVLMSTYNGAKFLQKQIDSIYAQEDVEIQLIVRDDGSTDGTPSILRSYETKGIRWHQGENCGAACSFMRMLYDAPESEYYALADQDDIWLPQKLSAAVKMVDDKYSKDIPILYFCNQRFLDEKECVGLKRHLDTYSVPGVVQIILGNDISGCTMFFNQALKKSLFDHKINEDILRMRYHDVWIAAMAAIYGKIVFDDRAFILFRRHGNNETDGRTTEGIRNNRSFRDYLGLIFQSHKQESKNWANEVLRCCRDDLEINDLEMLSELAFYDMSLKSKLILLKDKRVSQYWKGNKIGFYFKILLNWM